jgi:hypothetical protein
MPFSPAVRAGDFVFVSGQIPRDTKGAVHRGSIEEQTEAAIVQITRILNEAGCSLADVVKVPFQQSLCRAFFASAGALDDRDEARGRRENRDRGDRLPPGLGEPATRRIRIVSVD